MLVTDNNQYKSQLHIKLYLSGHSIKIKMPINVSVQSNNDYRKQEGVTGGFYTMLTMDRGRAEYWLCQDLVNI